MVAVSLYLAAAVVALSVAYFKFFFRTRWVRISFSVFFGACVRMLWVRLVDRHSQMPLTLRSKAFWEVKLQGCYMTENI